MLLYTADDDENVLMMDDYRDENEGSIITSLISQLRYRPLSHPSHTTPHRHRLANSPISYRFMTFDPDHLSSPFRSDLGTQTPEWAWTFLKLPSRPLS